MSSFSYDAVKIHALNKVTNPSNISYNTQDITYTPFHQPNTIAENNYLLTYKYGPDYQRTSMNLKQNGNTIRDRIYLGNYEIDIKDGVSREIHYINTPVGLISMAVKTGSNYDYYYTYTDHLGSILKVTSNNGTKIFEQNFDAWGRRRNANDWTYNSLPTNPWWLYRGYTAHEHLPEFGLINMNGRMYDAILGRMLSVDNYVADNTSTQAYNRYTYANNNPLKFVDPDGEFPWLAIGLAVVGAYATSSAVNGSLNPARWDWQNPNTYWALAGGAVVGALGGGILANGGVAAFGIQFGVSKVTLASISVYAKITTLTLVPGLTALGGLTYVFDNRSNTQSNNTASLWETNYDDLARAHQRGDVHSSYDDYAVACNGCPTQWNNSSEAATIAGNSSALMGGSIDFVRKEIQREINIGSNATAINRNSLEMTSKLFKYASTVGRVTGIVGAIDAGIDLRNDPKNVGNWVRFGANVAMIGAKSNFVTFGASMTYNILNEAGYIDKWSNSAYKYIVK